ncbi:MAG TPA: DEAD/DEAH box helicase [Kofleriaceae bacterium]|nr:DEAD/DEAH box helicase [Kofleriaceae bacterium]
MQKLLEAVREACPRGLWSQGVKLARDGAVTRAGGSGGEIIARVAVRGAPVAPTVVLVPASAEWECDCDGKFDACAHVAAAVIALSQEADGPGAARQAAMLRYDFTRAEAGPIQLRRTVSGDGPMQPTESDLAVGRLLGTRDPLPIDTATVPRLFAALAGCDRVWLDGAQVAVSGDAVSPRALVSDRGAGVRLAVAGDPAVQEIVGDAVALCQGSLHPLGHIEVAGARWQALPLVRDYAATELGELVTNMLPALRRDIEVEVRSRRLPTVTREALPRIAFSIEGDGERLAVLPTLVYGDPPLARIDGDKLVQLRGPAPLRDRQAEREVVAELRDRLNMVPGRSVSAAGSEARALAEKVRRFERGGGDDPDRAREVVRDVELVAHLELIEQDAGEAAGFDLWFEAPDGADEAEPRRASATAVAAAWQTGLDLVPLEGGGWAPLPADFLTKHGQRLLDLLAARDAKGGVPRVALPQLAALCDALEAPRPRAASRLVELLEAAGDRVPPATLPPGLTAELRPYQKVGVDWLCFLKGAGFGAVLADDMGLGKTVQTLAALDGKTLVACPTSVLHGWATEIARFRPDLRVCLFHGPRRALDPDADVVLTSYALLRLDRDLLAAQGWSALVLDEAQAIKNPDSQQAQAAFSIPAAFRVALSGTPVENRLEELWSVCHFTNPGLLGARPDFQRRFATPIAAGRADAAAFLREKIRPFLLRRLKKEVAPELPPRTEAIIQVDLADEERTLYDVVRAASRDEVVARLGKGGGVMEALEALLRLRQAACHPSLLPGQEAPTSSKVVALLEALESAAADGHKALVFSQWTSLLDLVEPHLHEAAIPFTRLDGSTRDRASVVRTFQDAAGPPVMLASLKAGGTGLNLTAADHVFILDPWWNPAAEDQAADRAHRIGQDRPVNIYRLVSRGTVEERILALQGKKRALADAALGEAGRAASLTRDDLLSLLDG